MEQPLTLVRRLDANAARQLATELAARRGGPLAIDAGGVETASALALEVLIAAGMQWRADGQPLTLAGASARFSAAFATLGLDPGLPWTAGGTPADDAPPAGRAHPGGESPA